MRDGVKGNALVTFLKYAGATKWQMVTPPPPPGKSKCYRLFTLNRYCKHISASFNGDYASSGPIAIADTA